MDLHEPFSDRPNILIFFTHSVASGVSFRGLAPKILHDGQQVSFLYVLGSNSVLLL